MNNHIRAIKSVYSFYFPEVRQIIDESAKTYPHDVLLKSVFPGLDNFHLPLIDTFVNTSHQYQQGLVDFKYKYFSNGSSEAIFHLLIDTIKEKLPIYVLKGEYEGYREYAKNLGVSVIELEPDLSLIKNLPFGRFFISNPSARNGNLIDNQFVINICELGHQVVIDLAYLGMTRPYQIDLTHKNIIAVVASLSKPYGLFYSRIGFSFCRKPLPTLYPNIWFKNIFSIHIALKILKNIKFGSLRQKYLSWQQQAITTISLENHIDVNQSDVFLLANLSITKTNKLSLVNLADFRRGEYYRFCLTPYFLDQQHNINN